MAVDKVKDSGVSHIVGRLQNVLFLRFGLAVDTVVRLRYSYLSAVVDAWGIILQYESGRGLAPAGAVELIN